MVEVVKGVHRIPTEIKLGTEEKSDKLPEIGMLINQTVELNTFRKYMV